MRYCLVTGMPENAMLATEVLSLRGIQAEKMVDTAGHMHPCKLPIRIRMNIIAIAPPQRTQIGVMSVVSEASSTSTTKTLLPPIRSATRPPGMCVST